VFSTYVSSLCEKDKNIDFLLSKLNILIIETDKESIDFLSLNLKDSVKNFFVISNFEKAFEILESINIDIILLDIEIAPNALSFAKEIKERYFEKYLIISSDFNDLDSINYLFDIGADTYLPKPIEKNKLFCMLKNVAQNKIKTQELEAKNLLLEQYKDAVDESTLVSKTDPKGVITYANEQFIKLSGYKKEELIGKPHNIVRHMDMSKEDFADMWNTLKNKKVWKGIVKNRTKNGTYYIVDATIIPILNTKSEIVEYVAIRHDITELEKYKDILKEELDVSKQGLEEKTHFLREYEKAINESNSVLRTDLNGVITYVNDSFCKLSGHSKYTLIGNTHRIVRHPSVPSIFFSKLWGRIKNKKIWRGVIKNIDIKNRTFYLATTIIPILGLKGEIVEYMSISQDVTDLINLHEELEETQKEIICTLGEVVETRSKETGNHIKRVAEYSALLGKYYGLSPDRIELLKLASPMHDVGKVGIADAILNKPGRFDENEFEIMKTHTNIGYEMLKSSKRDVLKIASVIAYEHHEKYNGKGYPNGISGESISIEGRITALADVFDALGSDRVYKKAWELDRILKLVKEERGEHFDPKLVDIFFEHLDEFIKIRDTYRDKI